MKKNRFINYKKAFTLAEVLITLVIIGVIAAITIPTVVANSKDEEIRSMLKKSHSVIAQALEFYYIDNGVVPKGGNFEGRTFKDVFVKHFNIAQDFGNTDFYYGDKDYDRYKNYYGNSNLNYYFFDDGQFILNDGTFIMIENPSTSSINNRVIISVDVNGPYKKPNRLGRDLFMFQVSNEGKLLAMGDPGTYFPEETYCKKNSYEEMSGAGCTSKMLRDKSK